MFDVGFWELCLVGLISLLVIGPERLPKAARVAGFWVGKTRRMVDAVKSEISEELRAEEMRQIMKAQAELPELNQARNEVGDMLGSVRQSVENMAVETPSEPITKAENERR